jgi:hypothetical protein
MDIQNRYSQLSVQTASNLKTIAQSDALRELSTLSLPEVEAIVDLVARVVPAGNVPGVILNGLARLPGRRPPLKTLKRDVNLLFRGVEQSLDKVLYSAIFAGPAAVIWGYQNLLKLAGKDPTDSFPEGMWQFYVDYALREDTARHACETHGFDTILNRHQIGLNPVDRITAWVMAAIHALHQYDDLLKNEWRERVYTSLLQEVTHSEPDADHYAQLYRAWQKQRPYGRSSDADPMQAYPAYRRVKFDQFLEAAMRRLPTALRQQWVSQARTAKENELPAYQQQLTILAYLDPGPYGETRTPLSLEEAHIGLVHRGFYYLIPACHPTGTGQPTDVATVRRQVGAILNQPPEVPPVNLTPLAKVRRTAWPELRRKLSPQLLEQLNQLRLAPILFNTGPCARDLPLSTLRQVERGLGDHALTLFDTGQSMVFDQSHVFFDGTWGAALAEIVTQEALAWAVYLNQVLGTPTVSAKPASPLPLTFSFQPAERDLFRQSLQVNPEAGAETGAVDLKAIQKLRQLFKRRSDLLQLTVNDLLVLYRAIHAATYEPDPALVTTLKNLTQSNPSLRLAATTALEAISPSDQVSPAIVIPVDASRRSPRDRLHPVTFEVPLAELDLLSLHHRTINLLDAYQNRTENSSSLYSQFDQLQRVYLATLAGFGAVMSKTKEIAVAGESPGFGHIKLLAHLPPALQQMLDAVPNRFDILNDLIKGREVLSNIGMVAPTSTLSRFMTAKDDNDKKTLAWGVITDAQGVMRITLRDFRPHVSQLTQVGRKDLATDIVQDYLQAYARGLNTFVGDLGRITQTSRETGLFKPEKRE